MKFKKGDRVEYIGDTIHCFTKGKIYTINSDGLGKYGHLCIEEDNLGEENGWKPEYFKLIEENKMKTDAKTMAKIWNAISIDESVCVEYFEDDEWHDKANLNFKPNEYLYRIKPETITLKNGVTIPKPLPRNEMKRDIYYYVPSTFKCLWEMTHTKDIHNRIDCFIYSTKEEAIEASKALFWIE